MNNDNTLIPQYRFPEFKNDGSWENRILGDLSNVVRGGSPRPIEDFLTNEISGLNWLKIADVSPDSKYITSTKERVIEEAASKTRIVNKGDLILSNSMSFGRPYILDITTCIHDGWIAISNIKSTEIEKDYLYYFISSDFAQKYFNIYAAGAAVKNLNAEIIKNLPIDYPNSRAEQQKIAACLSSLDDVIAGHEEKLTLLEEHKKGLMQNLFPQEGATQPKYRFPEFENDGDWVEDCIGNYMDLFSGIAIKSEDITDDENGTPILRGINITEGFIRHSIDIDKYYLKPIEPIKKYLTKVNDIVIGMDGSKVGKNVAQITERDENSILIQRVACIRNKNNSDGNYLYQQFISNRFIKYVDNVNTSSGIPHISAQQIKDFNIMIPPVLQEQQKIASVLSSVDELIVAQREKIEALKEHKKGLMQGLFPKINN